MNKTIRGWISVSQHPAEAKSENSYIRCRHVARISIVENENRTFSVLVHALGSTFLRPAGLETLQEATRQLESLVEEVSSSG